MRKLLVSIIVFTLAIMVIPPCQAAQKFTQGEADKFYFFLVTSNNEIATGEDGEQPQISTDGGTEVNTSDTLHHVSNGLYYITLTTSEVGTIPAGKTKGTIVVRYKGTATAEYKDIGLVEDPLFVTVKNIEELLFVLQRTIDFVQNTIEKEAKKMPQVAEVPGDKTSGDITEEKEIQKCICVEEEEEE